MMASWVTKVYGAIGSLCCYSGCCYDHDIEALTITDRANRTSTWNNVSQYTGKTRQGLSGSSRVSTPYQHDAYRPLHNNLGVSHAESEGDLLLHYTSHDLHKSASK
jgi:hypothetical protein